MSVIKVNGEPICVVAISPIRRQNPSIVSIVSIVPQRMDLASILTTE